MKIERISPDKLRITHNSDKSGVYVYGMPTIAKDDPVLLKVCEELNATVEDLEEALKDVKEVCCVCYKPKEFTFADKQHVFYVCSRDCAAYLIGQHERSTN